MKPTHRHARLHLAIFVLALAPQVSHAAVTWDAGAGGGDLNWSTFTNWSDDADPATKDIVFNNTGGAAGSTVTSIVDTNYTIDSLNFLQDNTVNQTLSISSGQILSVTGSFTPTAGEATAVLFGQPSDAGTTASTTNITGLGTFTVNNSANHFLVGYANATGNPTATVNMSGLSNFNATVDIFGVGRKGTTNANTSRQQAGVLTLARNNTITANEISVGSTTHINGTTGSHNNGGTSTLNLGSGGSAVNNLYADKISFGIGKAVGNMNFATGVASTDTVKIRAKNTTSAVGTFEIGVRNMSSSSGSPSGTVNFGTGEVDALITNLNIANWATGAGGGVSPSGTFTTGTSANSAITVTTANLALNSVTNAPGSAQTMTGNLNVTAGVFTATTVNLATGSNASGLTRAANLTVDGGTFRFGTFNTPVGGYNINFNSGTVASVNTTDRTLALNYKLGKADGGTTVVFGQASGGTGEITLNGAGTLLGHTTIETVQTTTIGGALTGAFNLTKTGSGTLNISNSGSLGGGTFSLKSTATGPSITLGLSGGLTVVNPIEKDSTTGREMILSSGTGNNALTGGMTITGAGANALVIANNQTSGNLTFSGGISGPGYLGSVSLRGTQTGAVGFFNGLVNIASALQNNGSTDWTVNSAGSTWSETQIVSAGGFILGGDNALALGARVNWTNTGTGKLDLAGYVQSVAGLLTANTAANVFNSSATADSTLTLANLAGGLTYAGTISDGATKKVSLVMNSAGRIQTLTGANTYSGDTTVTAGTLSLAQVNPSNEASTVSIATGATLDLAFTDTDTVNKLFINGVQQAAGIYVKAGTETAPEIGIAGITGTGKLNVTSNPVVASGFASWIDTPAFALTAGQKGPADDPDNDGMANLLEFVLNGNPAVSDASILPDPGITTSDFEFTFQRRDDSLSPETTQTFQYGGDLSGWTDVIIPAAGGTVGDATITVTAGIPDDGITDTVKVAILKTEATAGKLFGRLQVTQP